MIPVSKFVEFKIYWVAERSLLVPFARVRSIGLRWYCLPKWHPGHHWLTPNWSDWSIQKHQDSWHSMRKLVQHYLSLQNERNDFMVNMWNSCGTRLPTFRPTSIIVYRIFFPMVGPQVVTSTTMGMKPCSVPHSSLHWPESMDSLWKAMEQPEANGAPG